MEVPRLDQYVSHFAEMPFVRSFRLKPLADRRSEGSGVAVLTLKTPAGGHELVVEELRSHVTHEFATHLIERARGRRSRGENVLVLAPHIGVELGRRFS